MLLTNVLQKIGHKATKSIDKFRNTFKRLISQPLKTRLDNQILVREPATNHLQHRCLPELPGTVDGEVCSTIYQPFYGFETLFRIDHIVPLGVATARDVESFPHFASISISEDTN